jgi:hypothetical protein
MAAIYPVGTSIAFMVLSKPQPQKIMLMSGLTSMQSTGFGIGGPNWFCCDSIVNERLSTKLRFMLWTTSYIRTFPSQVLAAKYLGY